MITDGTSATYLFGEKFLAPALYLDINLHNGVSMMGDNQTAWAGYEWDNHRVARNPSSRWPKEAYQPQMDNNEEVFSNIYGFGSAHPGALHMAYCDGSVRSVSYDIGEETHQALAHRSDGLIAEPAGE
jgi:prepilin-type processing-associated H-X9-DG protein